MEQGSTTIGASHPSEADDFTNYFIGLSLVDVAFTEIHCDVYDIFFYFLNVRVVYIYHAFVYLSLEYAIILSRSRLF